MKIEQHPTEVIEKVVNLLRLLEIMDIRGIPESAATAISDLLGGAADDLAKLVDTHRLQPITKDEA